MDREAWCAAVHEVAKNQTRQSDWTQLNWSPVHPQFTALSWWRDLSNLMKLWTTLCRATEDGWVIGKSSDRACSTGRGNHNPPQYSCSKNPMNSVKKQKDMTMEDDPPSLCVDHNKLWKILQEMGIPDHHTCLRNLYVDQEATVRMDMEQWTGSNLERSMSRFYIVTLLI